MDSESEFPNARELTGLAIDMMRQEGSLFRVIFTDPNTQRELLVVRELLPEKPEQLPASEESIKSMPEVEISEAGKECTICLEELEVGAVAKEMPCKHRFHGMCVEKWLAMHGTCPMCRYEMPAEEKDNCDGGEEAENGGGVTWLEYCFTLSLNENTTDDGSYVDESSSSMLDDID